MRTGSAPGMTWDEAQRIAAEHARDSKSKEIPDHIRAREGGRAMEIHHEELLDLIADEQRRLSETRRNL